MPSPTQLFAAAVAADPARPRLTWYDDATGERVELSGRTLQNWVAKTAHLLTDDLGAGPGTQVSVCLPAHWTAAVWWLAVDAVGARLVPPAGPGGAPVGVAVVGPDNLADPPEADEVVAVSLRPLGAPFTDPLPPLVHDFAVEVRGQPDHWGAPAPGDDEAGRRAAALAAAWALTPTDRVRLAEGTGCDLEPVAWLTAALAADASVVWVRNPESADDVQRLVAEQVTAVVGVRGDGWPERIRALPAPSVS